MTNLKEAFSKIADGIFKIFKSFVVTGGNIVLPAQGYDPSTGDVTGSETLYPISEIIFTIF